MKCRPGAEKKKDDQQAIPCDETRGYFHIIFRYIFEIAMLLWC
ncbi:hypothetical protein Pvag_pPag30482 (plasmid) [Pantoea vagans C9-1]|nr:hypothetical protein Pvag_pPag30482 [Pantoea vagans C9-1]